MQSFRVMWLQIIKPIPKVWQLAISYQPLSMANTINNWESRAPETPSTTLSGCQAVINIMVKVPRHGQW